MRLLKRLRKLPVIAAAAACLVIPAAAVTAAPPASALTFTQQCTPGGQCMNFWGGGYDIRVWGGTSSDNAIQIQGLPGGKFQLRDNVHGGCVGDYGGSQTNARLGGGQGCNSTSTGTGGAWGTVFYGAGGCGGDYSLYESNHWRAYIGWSIGGNGTQVYANTGIGDCLLQES